jgi:hypothetical protein
MPSKIFSFNHNHSKKLFKTILLKNINHHTRQQEQQEQQQQHNDRKGR